MDKKIRIIITILFLVDITLSSTLSTQYVAEKLNYQEALDYVLFEGETFNFYFPFAIFIWDQKFGEEAPKLFHLGNSLFCYSTMGFGFLILFLRFWLRPNLTNNYGSARWATKKEIIKTKLLNGRGVFLGVLPSGEYLRDNEKTHILVVAPTRSGKGVGIVVPTSLTWKDSLLAIDIKGEIWKYASGCRSKYLNNICYKFEPTSLDSNKYNPFDEIRFGTPYEIRDIGNQINIILDPTGEGIKGSEFHWKTSAGNLLTGLILHIKYTTDYVCFRDILNFMGELDFENGEDTFQMKLNNCLNAIHDPTGTVLKNQIPPCYSKTHPKVKQIFTLMVNTPEKEFGSIFNTLNTILAVYNDPILAENTSYSDFSVNDLMDSPQPVTICLVVPPSDLDRLTPIFRMMIELVYRRNTEKLDLDENGNNKRNRTLLMLDEFPGFGRMDTFEKALAYIAGYGLKSVLITQGNNQINKIYTERNGIFDNCHIRVFYTPNDRETPKYISDMLGKQTIKNSTRSYAGSLINAGAASVNEQEMGRELMTANEVSTMDAVKEIVFVAGYPAIDARKIVWYEDENFKHRELPPIVIKAKSKKERDLIIDEKMRWRDKLDFSVIYEDSNENDESLNEIFAIKKNEDDLNIFEDDLDGRK